MKSCERFSFKKLFGLAAFQNWNGLSRTLRLTRFDVAITRLPSSSAPLPPTNPQSFDQESGLPIHSRAILQAVDGAAAPTQRSLGRQPSLLISMGIKSTRANCMHTSDINGSGAIAHQHTDGGGGERCLGTSAATGALEITGQRFCPAWSWSALPYF